MKSTLRDIAVLTIGTVTLAIFLAGPVAWFIVVLAMKRLTNSYPP